MDLFEGIEPVKIDLVYAKADHPRNIFGEALYHPNSRMWAHKDLAVITLMAARQLNKSHGFIFDLKDCLRTTEAQTAMGKTKIVQENPHWLEEPNRMVSPSGHGAHPRAMAIDVCLLDKNGTVIDMGTPFDDMSPESYRNCETLSENVKQNRDLLENAFMDSANKLGMSFLPIPSEWWDYRFPPETYHKFEALSDKDLPQQMQMTEQSDTNIPNFDQEHFDKLTQDILYRVNGSF